MENLKLTPEEQEELREGQEFYEMMQTPGWKRMESFFTDMAYHSWVDPREVSNPKEWEWRELNAFHAANNASQVIEKLRQSISRMEYLQKKKSGEIKVQRMKV